MIVTLGYVIIGNLQEKQCDVQRVQFSTQLATIIDSNRGWGTIKQTSIDTPCETTHVCFIDRRAVDHWNNDPDGISQLTNWAGWSTETQSAWSTVMEASGRAGDPTNIFTIQAIDGQSYAEPVERFSGVGAPIEVVNPGPRGLCVPVTQGRVELELRGLGTAVRIGELPS